MRTIGLSLMAVVVLSSFNFATVALPKHTEDAKENVNFRIRLCEYHSIIPVKKVELLRQIGATPVKSTLGSVYVTPPYETEQQAENDLPKFRALGFDEAQQVVEMGDELMSIDKYHDLHDRNKSVPADQTKHGVVRIWK